MSNKKLPPEDLPLEEDDGSLDSPNIHLEQFLKISGLVGTGGQAKILIQGGKVLVNSEVEKRRKRKLFPGDIVEVGGECLEVGAD